MIFSKWCPLFSINCADNFWSFCILTCVISIGISVTVWHVKAFNSSSDSVQKGIFPLFLKNISERYFPLFLKNLEFTSSTVFLCAKISKEIKICTGLILTSPICNPKPLAASFPWNLYFVFLLHNISLNMLLHASLFENYGLYSSNTCVYVQSRSWRLKLQIK